MHNGTFVAGNETTFGEQMEKLCGMPRRLSFSMMG